MKDMLDELNETICYLLSFIIFFISLFYFIFLNILLIFQL